MNRKILIDLRNVLAKLYTDERSIRRIVDDSGIDSSKLTIDIHTENSWHSVLSEAEKHYQVEALLQTVEHEYGNNREFQAACQAYRQSQGKQETVNPHANVSAQQPKLYPKTWRQRLPAVLLGILLVGLAGGVVYWGLDGLQPDDNITPTATAAISASGSSIPTELPTVTVAAVSPSPTSMVTVATATTAPTPTATIPQPTDTPSEVASALCTFAFLVLDKQSEEPIRRATIVVFVGVRQATGATDSNGYYLAKLPCRNEQDVEAQMQVFADGYSPYDRRVFHSDETTKILLERQATPTPNVTSTATFTPIPISQLTENLTPTTQLTAIVILTPTLDYPCLAEIYSADGFKQIRRVYTGPFYDSALRNALDVGKTVEIREASKNKPIFYHIWSVEGMKQELGWIAPEDLRLSPTCP